MLPLLYLEYKTAHAMTSYLITVFIFWLIIILFNRGRKKKHPGNKKKLFEGKTPLWSN